MFELSFGSGVLQVFILPVRDVTHWFNGFRALFGEPEEQVRSKKMSCLLLVPLCPTFTRILCGSRGQDLCHHFDEAMDGERVHDGLEG